MTCYWVFAQWFGPLLKYTEHKTTELLTACCRVNEICSSWNQILCFSIIQSTSLSEQEFDTFWVAVFTLAATFKPVLWTHLCQVLFCWGVQLGSSDLEFVLSLEFVPVARPLETGQRSCVDSPGRGELIEHELPWLQELTLPWLETKRSSELGNVLFRVQSLSCALRLCHGLHPLLDYLIDQKS